MEVDQECQTVYSVIFPSRKFYDNCEVFLNTSQRFIITVEDEKSMKYIKKYFEFFHNYSSGDIQKILLSINLRLFGYKNVEELYDIFLVALLYDNEINIVNNQKSIEITFTPNKNFNRSNFFASIDRETFPSIIYPQNKYYEQAVSYSRKNPFLATKIINKKKVNSFIVDYLNNHNIILSVHFIFPMYLKMYLDYIEYQLKWNILFYVENHNLFILCSSYTNEELIKSRSEK